MDDLCECDAIRCVHGRPGCSYRLGTGGRVEHVRYHLLCVDLPDAHLSPHRQGWFGRYIYFELSRCLHPSGRLSARTVHRLRERQLRQRSAGSPSELGQLDPTTDVPRLSRRLPDQRRSQLDEPKLYRQRRCCWTLLHLHSDRIECQQKHNHASTEHHDLEHDLRRRNSTTWSVLRIGERVLHERHAGRARELDSVLRRSVLCCQSQWRDGERDAAVGSHVLR